MRGFLGCTKFNVHTSYTSAMGVARMLPAVKCLPNINALLTVSEGMAVYPFATKDRVAIAAKALRSFSKDHSLLAQPPSIKVIQDILVATAYSMSHRQSNDGLNIAYLPKILRSNLLPFAHHHFPHNEQVKNLDVEISNTKDEPDFDWLSDYSYHGGVYHDYVSREADKLPKEEVYECFSDYVLDNKFRWAVDARQQMIINFPHDSAGYIVEMNILRKALSKTSLSSEQAAEAYFESERFAWTGCKTEKEVEQTVDLLSRDPEKTSRALIQISDDILSYYKKYGYKAPQANSKDFEIFRDS